jgi:hypothetical protein
MVSSGFTGRSPKLQLNPPKDSGQLDVSRAISSLVVGPDVSPPGNVFAPKLNGSPLVLLNDASHLTDLGKPELGRPGRRGKALGDASH